MTEDRELTDEEREEVDMAISNAAGDWLANVQKLEPHEQLAELKDLLADVVDLTDSPVAEMLHEVMEKFELFEADAQREIKGSVAMLITEKRLENEANPAIVEVLDSLERMVWQQ